MSCRLALLGFITETITDSYLHITRLLCDDLQPGHKKQDVHFRARNERLMGLNLGHFDERLLTKTQVVSRELPLVIVR